jgi:hypothetical protein
MENKQQTLLAQLMPKSLFQILEIYTQAWAKGITTPLIGFSLHNGQEVIGEVLHIDFPTEKLIIRTGEQALHATFLDFRYIQYFTLFGLDQHEDFVELF